ARHHGAVGAVAPRPGPRWREVTAWPSLPERFGGAVALAVLSRARERWAGLVLMGCPHPVARAAGQRAERGPLARAREARQRGRRVSEGGKPLRRQLHRFVHHTGWRNALSHCGDSSLRQMLRVPLGVLRKSRKGKELRRELDVWIAARLDV